MGRVAGVYLATSAGLPMRSVDSAVAVAGEGLLGDRYQAGTGEWSAKSPAVRRRDADRGGGAGGPARAEQGVALAGGAARPNLETRGVDLDAMVGRRFRVGPVVLRGERPCHPCRYLDRVTGLPSREALHGRGGLRATVVAGGVLRVGDSVEMLPAVLRSAAPD